MYSSLEVRKLQPSRVRPHIINHFNTHVLTFHDKFHWLKMWPRSWPVGLPYSPAILQITLSSVTPTLSWSWVECFHILWNEPSCHACNVVGVCVMRKFWCFTETEPSCCNACWGYLHTLMSQVLGTKWPPCINKGFQCQLWFFSPNYSWRKRLYCTAAQLHAVIPQAKHNTVRWW